MHKRRIGLLVLALVCLALPALAQEGGEPAGRPVGTWGAGALGAAFLLGVAAAAGAIAQGKATSAAAEGMSRNPGAAGPIRTMTIIGLALIESLVLYALLIAFLIRGV
ncbi:MAG TPA: ATP synthase F0 subunit C [Thermoanaerobaculia bacterium]|nr:ATP synthase F0 subunit C [Thermoanaerobaculia bacterium]